MTDAPVPLPVSGLTVNVRCEYQAKCQAPCQWFSQKRGTVNAALRSGAGHGGWCSHWPVKKHRTLRIVENIHISPILGEVKA